MVEPVAEEPEAQPEPVRDEEPAPAGDEAPPAEARGATAFATVEERRTVHRLEPLQPRPRRRWILFGPYPRREEQAEDDSDA